MSLISNNINICRICNSDDLTKVISLGEQYITSRFPVYGDWNIPKISIDICLCNICGLLQLLQTTNSSELYEYEYGYRSGISNTMRNHLQEYNKEIVNTVCELNKDDIILDIGSNDSTMLNFYPDFIENLLGIDPTGSQFKEYYTRAELVPDYFTKENFMKKYNYDYTKKCKIVSSISMFYDLPDPVQFAKDIHNILHDDGIWTCEQSYVLTMLKRNSIDTICHEHLEYYSLKQIKLIADKVDFKIINVLFNDCNGGSFRIYFAKKTCDKYVECCELINNILKEEIDYGLGRLDTYTKFMEKCDYEVNKLKELLKNINENGKNAHIYGASTKGNCLLQYGNIDETDIKYAVERNLNKVGKMTNTGIEIISEETMRQNPPNYLLVLPYHFKDEIIVRENEFLENGGKIIFPLPELQIVGKNKKVIITGCDGHISSYVKELLSSKYDLYGIGHLNKKYEKNILKYYFDMTDKTKLEFFLDTIHPHIIIHLAGISNSSDAYNNPVKTIEINGISTVNLCDIIHKKQMKTILFNSSSSEMYKGHETYFVNEDDTHKYHLHPYSIAKIMGHNVVDFYRETYNLPFSNGIFFTIESKYKKNSFLLNKVACHAKKWNETKDILILGDLSSYRNILHAHDASRAIETIIECDKFGNYVICNNENYKIIDLVKHIYSFCGIKLYEKIIHDKVYYYEDNTNLPVIEITNEKRGYDTSITNINSMPIKLTKLGWSPTISIHDILCEIFINK